MKTETCTFQLTGMICPACEDEVNTVLLHTRGVRMADASYRRANVVIQYDPEIISEEHFPEILKEAGYPVGGSGRSGLWSDLVSATAVAGLYYLIPKATGLVAVPETEAGVSCTALFLVGLLTGVHCIGMCGGIMLGVCPMNDSGHGNVWLYNTGRVLGYTVMGAVLGLIGITLVYDMQMKSMLQTVCGILVMLVGLKQWGIPLMNRVSLQLTGPCRKTEKRRAPLIVGILNGLMPCGALSSGWLIAAASGSAFQGAMDMLCFGAGTLPAMLLFGSIGKLFPKRFNRYIIRGSTVIILALGLRMAARGIGILL